MLWGPGQQQQQQKRTQAPKQQLKRPKSASVLRSASIAQPVQTSNGSGNNDSSPYYSNQFSPNGAGDRRYMAGGGDEELFDDEGGERVVRISPQAQYHGGDGQFSFPPQVDADAVSENGSVRGGGGSAAFSPSSRASGSFQRQSSQQRGGGSQHQRPSSAASYSSHQQQHRGPAANADGATNERLYRHSAIKAAQLAHRMQKAAEDREAAEAAARRSRPEISAYARSLPRLSDEVQFNRIARPTIDRHLMQTYAQATEADAFSFAPKLCEKSARILEARGGASAAVRP